MIEETSERHKKQKEIKQMQKYAEHCLLALAEGKGKLQLEKLQ